MEQVMRQLLEAHVQHELARFRAKRLRQTIRDEVAIAFQWLGKNRLREILTPEQIVALIDRNVVQLPIVDGIGELALDMSRRVLASSQNAVTSIQDICPRGAFEAAVARVAELEGPRRDFIHRLVTSSIYTEQISSALFNGIKDYLLTENMLAQKVPGLSSLIKLGKYAVNKTMRPLEAAVEKTVRAYIETSLGSTIRRSEASINEHFDTEKVVHMGARIWGDTAPRKLAEFLAALDADKVDGFVGVGFDFWLHFRRTPYFKAIHTELVGQFFDKYGDNELGQIVADLGVTDKMVVNELLLLLGRGIESALASGFLEQRIRARLEDFYRSAPAARLVAGHGIPSPIEKGAGHAADSKPQEAAARRRAVAPPASSETPKPVRRNKRN